MWRSVFVPRFDLFLYPACVRSPWEPRPDTYHATELSRALAHASAAHLPRSPSPAQPACAPSRTRPRPALLVLYGRARGTHASIRSVGSVWQLPRTTSFYLLGNRFLPDYPSPKKSSILTTNPDICVPKFIARVWLFFGLTGTDTGFG